MAMLMMANALRMARPRVALAAAVRAASTTSTAQPPPISSKAKHDEVIAHRAKYLSPSLRTFLAYDEPIVIAKGFMQYLWDDQGNKFVDLPGQNVTVSVGHCHPKVVKAAMDQMQQLSHCSSMYYHEQPVALAKELVERMPKRPDGEDWVVHLVCSGSDAVDLAIQMARVYTGRSETIGLHKAYHGLQGYAAGVTATGKSTQPAYSSMFTSISHVPSNDFGALESHIRYSTGGKLAAFIAEPVQGYGGIFPLDDGYLRNAFDLVKQYGGVTISDEVQTGFNRCGDAYWGFDLPHNKAMPDMITVAKGMGGGVGILGAVICKRSIAEAFTTKMWFNTFGSNPVSAAASRAVLRVMDEENIGANCRKMSSLFRSRLAKACEKYPQALKEIRGSGLFLGLEASGKNLEDSGKNAFEMHRRMRPLGILIGRGSAAGNVFRIQPPMCIEEHDVHHVCDVIEQIADEFIKEKKL